MKKTIVLQAVLAALEEEFQRFQSASRRERMAGNDEESRAEDKYDTRSTESNYLADGHARQALGAIGALEAFRSLADQKSAVVSVGSLVQVELGDEPTWFFMGPSAGGLSVQVGKMEVTVITPSSPIGIRLAGLKAGAVLKDPPLRVLAVK